ncbi:hypothetical protein GZ77_06675 [Endozoicomonas montiporae]|uniref:Abnormal spindle-like microcephaly-associated protein ASH domain-containing protein n=2 Tax=Endozoicomonas montiporae TaxID=1027273 RepID=A0A081N6Q8_9GAMM|nr:hypothetical protein [Endozoicomonas montiporae]AMO56465.1 hypothetical protein EZMO1_2370 [Endozoicomonas montiporae CL-33]KEQ14131.1 hypothetical protein GZ77_06675 [Endozoicomonas montiporae]
MQKQSATFFVLTSVFFSGYLQAGLSFDKHIDFGHVPAGAEKTQTIMICNTDPNESLLLDKPPEGFRFLNEPAELTFSESRCHELEVVFAPAMTASELTEHGDARGKESPNLFLTGTLSASEGPVKLTSLSGLGVSRQHWMTLYPPHSDTYFYHTQMDFNKTTDFAYKDAATISSATFSASSEIVVSFKNTHLTKILLTDNRGKWDWSINRNLKMPAEYCSLSLSPDQQWVVGGDAYDHKIDLYKARDVPINPLASLSPTDRSKHQKDKLYRVCSTVFSATSTHLFALGSSLGNKKPTWLTAWQFNQALGRLEQVTDQVQVGRTTENNFGQSPHGIAVSRKLSANYVVASHQHLSKHPIDRFYFNDLTGKFKLVNQIKTKIVPSKLSMTSNGQFVVIAPFLSNQPMEIHQCYSGGCDIIQTADKYIHPDFSFAPHDVQFAYRSNLLAVAEEDEDRLTILKPQNGILRWEVHQSLSKKKGFMPLVEPTQLEFSKDNRWLMAVSQSRLLIFAKLQFSNISQTIRWRSAPRWWTDYLSELCMNDSDITSKAVCVD